MSFSSLHLVPGCCCAVDCCEPAPQLCCWCCVDVGGDRNSSNQHRDHRTWHNAATRVPHSVWRVLLEGFVLSVCPEIWLRIPSLSICFLRICMINLAMCMLQLRWCSGISTDTIYYSISRWQRTTEFFFSTHKPQNLLIHTYRTKSSTTTTWQDLRSPNLHPTNPT